MRGWVFRGGKVLADLATLPTTKDLPTGEGVSTLTEAQALRLSSRQARAQKSGRVMVRDDIEPGIKSGKNEGQLALLTARVKKSEQGRRARQTHKGKR